MIDFTHKRGGKVTTVLLLHVVRGEGERDSKVWGKDNMV
jgi:hypothetical protein